VTLVNLTSEIKGQSAGAEILRAALLSPFRQLMLNAGLNAEALLAQVQTAKTGMGVDVMNFDGKLVDLKAGGIIDPARVTHEAVATAVSLASTSITMGALIAEIPEPKSAPMPDMGGMGGMM